MKIITLELYDKLKTNLRFFLRYFVSGALAYVIEIIRPKAELQELVDRLDRVSRKNVLLINVDKTKVMASDGIACRILIEQLEQINTFPYLGVPDYRR